MIDARLRFRHHGAVRRILPFVVAGSILVAGCASGGGDETTRSDGGSATSSTTAAAEDAEEPVSGDTTVPNAPPTTAARGRTAPTTTAAAGRTPSTSAAGTATAPAPNSDAVGPTPADDGRLGPPGSYARTMLRPRPVTALVVERFHQRGAEPASRTVELADATLREVAKKDVTVRPSVLLDGDGQGWTADEIRAVADEAGRVPAGGATAVLRLLFLRGSFEGDDAVLGVAVRGDVVVVFSEAVDGARTPVLGSDAIEEAVVVHELGHVLGLVDLARDTGRADPDHPGHSSNSRSVMYWAVESSLVGQVLTGPPPREFDTADLDDLEALRTGA